MQKGTKVLVKIPLYKEAVPIILSKLPHSKAAKEIHINNSIWGVGGFYWDKYIAGTYGAKYLGVHAEINAEYFSMNPIAGYVMYANVVQLFLHNNRELPKNYIGKETGGTV